MCIVRLTYVSLSSVISYNNITLIPYLRRYSSLADYKPRSLVFCVCKINGSQDSSVGTDNYGLKNPRVGIQFMREARNLFKSVQTFCKAQKTLIQ
jgi:hypothetical protein